MNYGNSFAVWKLDLQEETAYPDPTPLDWCITVSNLKESPNMYHIHTSSWYILYTVCPRSSDPFYIVTYYTKLVTTSWTEGIFKKSITTDFRGPQNPDPNFSKTKSDKNIRIRLSGLFSLNLFSPFRSASCLGGGMILNLYPPPYINKKRYTHSRSLHLYPTIFLSFFSYF